MNCRSGMFCHICKKQLPSPKHFAFAENGEIETMCEDCHEDIKRFFVKGVNASGSKSGRANKVNE